MKEERKNLIVLSSDEMRGDCPSFMGNADCRTPNLDRFAGRGVVFENHFAVHSKCVPSRISMFTGRYCHTDGVRSINESNHLPAGTPNLLTAMKGQGYETAVFGLNHVWQDFWGDNSKGSGCTDYHSYTKGCYDHFTKKQWPVEAPGPLSAKGPQLPEGYDYVGRIDQPLTGFCDDTRAEQAIDYLTRTRDRSRPFFMQVNLSSPHPKYRVEEPYFSMYDRRAIRPWPHDLPAGAPLHMRKMREFRTALDADEEALREVQAVYYGMITKVDVLLGRILSAIEDQGLLGNSVVMFWVDHGDFAGQYGLVEKWDTCMADCLLRVPLILHAPPLPAGLRVDALTETTDLAPTLLALLGIRSDWGLHGESLLPIIAGRRRKPAVFADGGHEDEMLQRFSFPVVDRDGRPRPLSAKQVTYQQCPDTMARAKMVRTEKWKMVIRLRGGNELYSMQDDPWELNNLWGRGDLAPIVMDLQQQMLEWCLRTDTDRPRQEQVGA